MRCRAQVIAIAVATASAACGAPSASTKEGRAARVREPRWIADATPGGDASPPLSDAGGPGVAAAETFSIVVEGSCSLDVSHLENATFIHDGYLPAPGETNARFALARVTDADIDEDPHLLRGLVAQWGGMEFRSMRGRWPDAAEIVFFFEHSSPRETYVWKGDRWKYGAGAPVREKWIDGSMLELDLERGVPRFSVVPKDAAPVPDVLALGREKENGCNFDEGGRLIRPGELWLAGQFCVIFPEHDGPFSRHGEAGVAHWIPGSPLKVHRLPIPSSHFVFPTTVRALGLTSVLVSGYTYPKTWIGDAAAYLAEFDGREFRQLPTPYTEPATPEDFDVEVDGTVWVIAGGAIHSRGPKGEWTKEPLEAVTSGAWIDHRPVWAIAKKTLKRRGPDGTWSDVALPKPAFSRDASMVPVSVARSPLGQIWVTAFYTEARPEWSQPERRAVVLKLGPWSEPRRCEAGFADERSYLHWPKAATESCKTPFVVLVRASRHAPSSFDYPQTRQALRTHGELAGMELVDVEIDERRYFGARAKTYESAGRIAEVVGKGSPTTRPEVVCLEPNITRTWAFDFATGVAKASVVR